LLAISFDKAQYTYTATSVSVVVARAVVVVVVNVVAVVIEVVDFVTVGRKRFEQNVLSSARWALYEELVQGDIIESERLAESQEL
jgi:hypothetical protein